MKKIHEFRHERVVGNCTKIYIVRNMIFQNIENLYLFSEISKDMFTNFVHYTKHVRLLYEKLLAIYKSSGYKTPIVNGSNTNFLHGIVDLRKFVPFIKIS